MSQVDHGVAIVELSCRVGDLQITVRGPLDQAAAFVRSCTGDSSSPERRGGGSETSFDLVSEAPASAAETVRPAFESRDQIQASFLPCPAILVAQGDRLTGAALSGPERVKRAWTAGQWGQAVLQGRAASPNRTPQLGIKSRFYVVLRADGLSKPTLFKSARSYWAVVGELESSSSVSHAFPSEQEAKVYLEGAGISSFDTRQ